MTDQTAAQEPTMEEILASIRRIISEDDAPADTAQPAAEASQPEPAPAAAAEEAAPAPQPDPEPEPQPAPALEAPADDDVLDLTDRYQAPAAETIGDLDVSESAPEPFPAAEPHSSSAYAPEPQAEPERRAAPEAEGSLLGEAAASSAASAFAGLASSVRRPTTSDAPPIAGPTIDEITRELLRPMLKEWLDANLPNIVEAAVRKEVERIARSAA